MNRELADTSNASKLTIVEEIIDRPEYVNDYETTFVKGLSSLAAARGLALRFNHIILRISKCLA